MLPYLILVPVTYGEIVPIQNLCTVPPFTDYEIVPYLHRRCRDEMLHHREFNVKSKTLFKHRSREVGFGLGEGIDSAHSAV